MIPVYSKAFQKSYHKLPHKQRELVDLALRTFADFPQDKKLRNHALQGNLKGYRSISASFDLRIVFEEKNGYMMVIFINVGTHNQVY